MKNKDLIRYIICVLPAVFLCSCTSSNAEKNVGIEKAAYSVIEKKGAFEIRRYEPCIIAETIVESNFQSAGNIAFGRLFNYISGQNRKKESIAMTAPVNQKAASEKIAMTAPVSQQKVEDKWSVSFLMPSKYTIKTIPEPVDPSVVIKEIPARKMAAVRYSGTWSKKHYDSHKALLEKFIQERGLKASGSDIFARYDPPFQLFFLRRNEVLIPVE